MVYRAPIDSPSSLSPSSGFAANIGEVWVTCVAANRFGLSATRKFSVMIAPFESVRK